MRNLDINDDLVPRNARKVAKIAIDHLWKIQITYIVQADGKANVAVRMGDSLIPRSAWAIWIDGLFDSAACSSPFAGLNMRDLIKLITDAKDSP